MKLVPKRRFKEFQNADAWEQRELREVVQRVCVGFVGTLEKYYTDSTGIPLYRTGNLNGLKLNTKDLKYVTKQFHLNNAKSQLKYGDILIARHGENGKAVFYESYEEANCLNIVIIRPNIDTSNSIFLANYINSPVPNQQIKNLSAGSTQVVINTKEIEKLTLYFPLKKEEQEKIGSFFKQLDETIALHQRKLEKTKALKSAYLAEMFPAEGERVPKRRFAGFIDEWEELKLKDLAEIVRGASPRPIQDPKWFDKNSDIGWLRISDVTEQNGRINYLKQRLSILGQEKTRVLNEPHLLLSIAATVGKPVVNYVQTGVHDGFLIFKNPKFDREFMFQWLEMFRPMWNKYGQPGSQVNLNSDIVKEQMVFVPSLEEQEMISKFFTKLDDKITTQQQKLNKLKAMKQAYLQEMFV